MGFLKDILPLELNRPGEAPPEGAGASGGPDSFLQSAFWGKFKASFGWKALAFRLLWENGEKTELLVLWRQLIRPVALAYIPRGEIRGNLRSGEEKSAALAEIACLLKKFLPGNTAFVRFDPPWSAEGRDNFPPPPGKPFVRAGADIQPPDTVVLDLTQSKEELFAGMKSKWRYNIRLGDRKVLIKKIDVSQPDALAAGIEVFYGLFRETSARDGIAMHSLAYYKKLFELGREKVRLYLAEHEGAAVAGIITLFFGQNATYLYGASSNRHRNLMANYALQWRAINDAKEAGCASFDFFGIPPDENPAHPMAGLYRFKTGFGGKIIHRPGSFDYPYKKLIYRLFSLAEKSRKSFRDIKKFLSRRAA